MGEISVSSASVSSSAGPTTRPSPRSVVPPHVLIAVVTASVLLSPCSYRGVVGAVNDDPAGTTGGRRNGTRVAIIGGGVGGTFAARYLAEYDAGSCLIESVTLFDPTVDLGLGTENDDGGNGGRGEGREADGDDDDDDDDDVLQGSRISSLTLPDGTVVEIGASIIYSGNRLAREMIESDGALVMQEPFASGRGRPDEEGEEEQQVAAAMPTGFGIYDGSGMALLTSRTPAAMKKFQFLYRYNVDLIRLSRAVDVAVVAFDKIYDLLESESDESSFPNSPDGIWEAVGLLGPSRMSFDDYLDSVGISTDVTAPWWRSLLPGRGRLRDELVTGANLSNYNQNNTQLNGLAGLVSFVPTKGELFSVRGGNDQIPPSALRQARRLHESAGCGSGRIRHVRRRVTSVVATTGGTMELWSSSKGSGEGENTTPLGEYDVVVLAAPLQQCRIKFLLQSHVDDSVLSPLPLNGLVDGNDNGDDDEGAEHDGHGYRTPPELPSSATRTYRQTVTTVVTNATLQIDRLGIPADGVPKSVYFTQGGKDALGISSVTQISPGVFKMFSDVRLSDETLRRVFGDGHDVVHVKVWGGVHGGAYPSFEGGQGEASVSTPFLLYEGGGGAASGGKRGAGLYYVNAMEASVAAIEISAIGAKAVAKLIARRFGLIGPKKGTEMETDEL